MSERREETRDKSPSKRHHSRERVRSRERHRSRDRIRSKERHRSRERIRSRDRRDRRNKSRNRQRNDSRENSRVKHDDSSRDKNGDKSRNTSVHKSDSYQNETTSIDSKEDHKSAIDVDSCQTIREGERLTDKRNRSQDRSRSRDRSRNKREALNNQTDTSTSKDKSKQSNSMSSSRQDDEKHIERHRSKTPNSLQPMTSQKKSSRFDSLKVDDIDHQQNESSKKSTNEPNLNDNDNGRISRDEQSRLKVEILKRQAGYDTKSTLNSKTEESRIDRISRQAQQKIKDEITQKHSSFKSNDIYEKVVSKEEIAKAEAEEKIRIRKERLAIWKSQQQAVAAIVAVNDVADKVIKTDSTLESPLSVDANDVQTRTKPTTIFANISQQVLQSKSFLKRKSVFMKYQSEDEDIMKQSLTMNENIKVTISDSSVNTEAEQLHLEVIDPLDSYMNEVGEEVERLNDVIIVQEVKKVVAFDVTIEEIMMPETKRDPRDKKEVVLDLDDPDVILAPVSSKFNIKKKDLITVDHSLVDYKPFRKDFWVEPPEFAKMSPEELELRLLELDNIKIRGIDYPKPIQRWTQCGLTNVSYDILQKQMKLAKPTSIQAQAIPCIMSGRDVIGVAKTGSGKTLAFLLPLLRHVKDQTPVVSLEGPIALVMTPTRELALQIHRECKHFAKALNLKSVCVYGGAPIRDQIADLKRGAEIVICTPGRIIDLLTANNGRVTNLRRVTMLVLDEADRMFDMGFEPQVMKIVQNIRPGAQTILFSATFPRQMEALARKVLKKPVEISVGGKSVVCQDVTQYVEVVHEDAKFVRLLEILGKALDEDQFTKILIFVDKHESADNMLKDLMRRGYPCQALHGGQDQADRDSTIQDFKQGHTSILIATSVAARGLDVKMLKIVVNYECPNHMEDYVHRVGRTGRAGNKGESYTFLTPDQDKFAIDIMKALKMSGSKIPVDVQKLGDKYLDKIKAGTVKSLQAGYGGKGLERLELDRNSKKQIQKASHVAVDALDDAMDEESKKSTAALATTNKKEEEPEQNALMSMAKAVDVSAGMNAGGRFTLKAANGCVAYEIEVNGFPQQARFIITGKDVLQEISQLTGAAVTVRGGYIPPNRVPKPNERRLYLYIEGTTKEMIDRAKNEIRRSLFQQTMISMEDGQSSSIPFSSAGRYSVL